MIDYAKILATNYFGKQWTLNGNSYDGLTWLDESTKPTKEELDSQWNSVQIMFEQSAYKKKRQIEYPSFADQFDLLFHGGMDAWKAAIQAVKDKYPKA